MRVLGCTIFFVIWSTRAEEVTTQKQDTIKNVNEGNFALQSLFSPFSYQNTQSDVNSATIPSFPQSFGDSPLIGSDLSSFQVPIDNLFDFSGFINNANPIDAFGNLFPAPQSPNLQPPEPPAKAKEADVPQRYPVYVSKPVPVKVPVRVPVEVPKPYPVRVLHPVPVPVKIKVPVPVEKPYPVTITRTVVVPVEKPVYIRVPQIIQESVSHPYPIQVPKGANIALPPPGFPPFGQLLPEQLVPVPLDPVQINAPSAGSQQPNITAEIQLGVRHQSTAQVDNPQQNNGYVGQSVSSTESLVPGQTTPVPSRSTEAIFTSPDVFSGLSSAQINEIFSLLGQSKQGVDGTGRT